MSETLPPPAAPPALRSSPPLSGFFDAFWWGLTRVVRWKKAVSYTHLRAHET